MIFVADNGATKCEWMSGEKADAPHRIILPGCNPSTGSQEAFNTFSSSVKEALPVDGRGEVFFYSTGTAKSSGYQKMLKELQTLFPGYRIHLETDLTGAGRALFGSRQGIAAILGTGANAGFYDGLRIVHQPLSLGFLLGDEGSAAYMGKMLLKAWLEETLPEELQKHFTEEIEKRDLNPLQQFYQKPSAAETGQLLTLMQKFSNNPYVEEMVDKAFRDFYHHIVSRVESGNNRTIGFTGSVAAAFIDILKQQTAKHHYVFHNIVKSPVQKLWQWHTSGVNRE